MTLLRLVIVFGIIVIWHSIWTGIGNAGSLHKASVKNNQLPYDYVQQYNLRADQLRKINRQKRNWYRTSKRYRRNPAPSNPVGR